MPACICGALKRLLGFEFPGESFWSCDQNNGLHMTWLTASLQATLEAKNVGTATEEFKPYAVTEESKESD